MSGNVESMTSGRVTTNDLQQRITAWSAEYDDDLAEEEVESLFPLPTYCTIENSDFT
ncbi:hypothetical protein T4D_7646 [Trichinella pseudospiralis]|uniref:Uncharacterized protein n=1 Tax=Trichinella pseudospiralis TaxID=6337 RepID=A0A0V1G1N5_TRIPS|nr:hypothetical protein T4D_7646 [Trichinella pseudospiralis]